jgi:hypothetical protein
MIALLEGTAGTPPRPRRRHAVGSGGFAGMCPEIIIALVLGEARWHLLSMKEVAHDAIRHRPVIAVDAMMMWAQPRVPRELKSTRSAKAHAPRDSEGRAKRQVAEFFLGVCPADDVKYPGSFLRFLLRQGRAWMGVWAWGALFVVANAIGVETFKAAVTLPADEALLPRLLSVPLVGLAAISAARVMTAWSSRER